MSADSLDADGNTPLLRVGMVAVAHMVIWLITLVQSTLHFDNEDWVEIETTSAVVELLLINSERWRCYDLTLSPKGASLEATDPQCEQTALAWAIKTCKVTSSLTLTIQYNASTASACGDSAQPWC